MDTRRDHTLEQLLEVAVTLDIGERAGFLDRACAGDGLLRDQLEARIVARERAGEPVAAAPILASLERARSVPGAARAPLGPGVRIGQYELIRLLGRGGMSVVYLARDTRLGRRVAIKFLRSNEPRLAERFLIEARATARCSHENIVIIHDADTHRGFPFIVLEYLKGPLLARLLERAPLPPGRAVQLMVPVVRALVCAHRHRIVHRDLKPENILVTSAGAIKVLDFGIAKFLHGRSPGDLVDPALLAQEPTLPDMATTQRGALLGTMAYMAPEQWGADKVDHRADLWAVGIMLYHMVTGRHPLAPRTGLQLSVVSLLDQPMPGARDAGVALPAALADIIDRCLRKPRDERFASARELLDALERMSPDRARPELGDHERPYTGLVSFQEADAHRFFGRSGDIATLLALLTEQPLVGIAGASGVGKSSFVRAGVISALKRSGEAWEALVIRPGRDPMGALASVLEPAGGLRLSARRLRDQPGHLGSVLRERARSRGCKILVFVDQFEELYTLTADSRARRAFTACLAGVADDPAAPLRVVLAIRSDFLDRVAEDRPFMAELGEGLFFLTPPDRDGLREALTRPAEMVGYGFESDAMVARMLDVLESTPGSLPLLQFTAAKLWEARDPARRLLTEQSYASIGGLDGALASHANAVLHQLAPQEQALARVIFLRLVTPERTRAPVLVRELRELARDPGLVQRVIDHLVDERLLMVQPGDSQDGACVEIVHESLIHSWPMLGHWLDEGQEDIAFLEQLRTAARQWAARGRPAGLLWRGEAMEEARRWHRRYPLELPALQKEYLHAVLALAARAARIKRLLVAGTMIALALLVVAAFVALLWIRSAEQEARVAERQVREQLARVQEEARARRAAERAASAARDQVALSREALARKNAELRDALAEARDAEARARRESERAQRESERARQESARARDAADAARRASEEARQASARLQGVNAELQRMNAAQQAQLAREQARIRELERKVGTIGNELKE